MFYIFYSRFLIRPYNTNKPESMERWETDGGLLKNADEGILIDGSMYFEPKVQLRRIWENLTTYFKLSLKK